MLRRTGTQPALKIADDVVAMMALPPVAPSVGFTERVRFGRDYYVRVLGNVHSVDPAAIGRFVDITAFLTSMSVSCAGHRAWALLGHPEHHHRLGPCHLGRGAATRLPNQARRLDPTNDHHWEAPVGVRALSDSDDLFALKTSLPGLVEGPDQLLEVV